MRFVDVCRWSVVVCFLLLGGVFAWAGELEDGLYEAALQGDVKAVQAFIDQGADVNYVREESWREGATPLSAAVRSRNLEVVQTLLAVQGINPDGAEGASGENPLGIAVHHEDIEAVRLLVDAGADVHAPVRRPGGYNQTDPLFVYAVRGGNTGGNIDIVRILLDSGRVEVDRAATDSGGRTALWHALYRGGDMLRLLLEAGADPDQPDLRPPSWSCGPRERAIDYVMGRGDIDTLRILLEGGANPNLEYPGPYLAPPLYRAARGNCAEAVRLLLQYGAPLDAGCSGEMPLFASLKHEDPQALRALLEGGADPNEEDAHHRVPLLHASHPVVVACLLEYGADPNWFRCDVSGSSSVLSNALDRLRSVMKDLRGGRYGRYMFPTEEEGLAEKRRLLDKILLLLRHGAHADAGNGNDRSVWSEAVSMGCMELVIFLLDGSLVDINALDNFRNSVFSNPLDHFRSPMFDRVTALFDAVVQGNPELVVYLLERGADVNVASQSGWTPLHAAVRALHFDLMTLLLEHGANVNATTTDDLETPLSLAAHNKSDDAVRQLLVAGARMDLEGGEDDSGNPRKTQLFRELNGLLLLHENILELLIARGLDTSYLLVDHINHYNGLHPERNKRRHDRVIEQFRLLLRGTRALEGRSRRGCSPFAEARYQRFVPLVRLFIEHGASWEPRWSLNLEVEEEGAAMLRAVLPIVPPACLDQPDSEGSLSPLCRAVILGDIEKVELLIQARANVNYRAMDYPYGVRIEGAPVIPEGFWAAYRDRYLYPEARIDAGFTPLSLAILTGNEAVVHALVYAGADPFMRTEGGYTAIELAEATRQGGIADFLRNADVILAVFAGDAERLEALATSGANLNVGIPGVPGTVLHFAVMKELARVVRTLVSCGADVHVYGENEATPLHDAVDTQNVEIVEILLGGGADPLAENAFGNTPLRLAGHLEDWEIVDLLQGVESDPDIDVAIDTGAGAFVLGMENGFLHESGHLGEYSEDGNSASQ